MCTAATYQTKDFYFGRTLDYEHSFGEEVALTTRGFPLPFREGEVITNHYAIIGMAHVRQDYPLYYDAVNEKGLAMAGLNFVGNAYYGKAVPGKTNVAQFELIPWILGKCDCVAQAVELLKKTNLTDTAFGPDLPPAQLHWMIADRTGTIVVESMKEGLRIYENPAGVLTNNPPFEQQMLRLNDYMQLSAKVPENRFSKQLTFQPYSRGMGAMGLPGDLSSQSRFVRAAFLRANSVSAATEWESVGQFFHILDSVAQPRGCCDLGEGNYEITIYASCCNADKGIYYYTTYENRQITAVDLHREQLDGRTLIRYPLVTGQQICMQN